MGVLATDNKELIYIYSDRSDLGKKMLAYAESNEKPLRAINIEKEKISDTVWLEIADILHKPLSDLFSPDLAKKIGIDNLANYNNEDLIKIIQKNPFLLQHPIAINGNKAKLIHDRFDFFRFYKKDGGNFDKSPDAIGDGEHTDTTGDEPMSNDINEIDN